MGEIVYACIAPHPPIIVPEVGGGRERDVQRTLEALEDVGARLQRARPDSVLLISPHGPGDHLNFCVVDAERATGTLARFGAPQVMLSFRVDRLLADEVAWRARAEGLPVNRSERWASGLDWGCTVPLYHLRKGMGAAGLVAVSASGAGPAEHHEFGRAAGHAVAAVDRRVAVVCSADLSHALKPGAPGGYYPGAAAFDREYRRAVAAWDLPWILAQETEDLNMAAEDAVRQTAFLMGVLEGLQVRPEVLSYDDAFGVGYLVASLQVEPAVSAV